MFNIIVLFFLLTAPCLSKDKGEIIILLGTSTSGKTTLIKTIKDIYTTLDDCSMDIMRMIKKADRIKEFYPHAYADLLAAIHHEDIGKGMDSADFYIQRSNVPDGIKQRARASVKIIQGAESLLKVDGSKQVSDEQQQDKSKAERDACDQYIITAIAQMALSGKNLITDTSREKNVHALQEQCSEVKHTVVLVFCSLASLSKRVLTRNERASHKGDMSEMRKGFPLWQYIDLYKKRESAEEPLLETLTRRDAEKAYDTHLIVPTTKTKRIASRLGYEKCDKETFLSALGFTSSDIERVEITPRNAHYDLIIDNTQDDLVAIADSAKKILIQAGMIH
ncbi:MAG: hypothetical protein K2X98_06730 [Alphaproteobacteria bacterium]|nr:hypothetical protein [Alphaproteobacteria bacterium]